MAKQKFYVVWKGRQTGVFETWDDCKAQTNQFPKAVYKSFKTRQLAEQAFKDEWWEYIGKDIFETELTEEQLLLVGKPIEESISVDGAWNTSTGVVEYQGVHTKTKELNLSDYVIFTGIRDDMPSLYASCDIMANASYIEGLPITILEAMASHLPVIATRVGAVGQVIKDQENGILLEAGDPDALALAISELAVDQQKRKRVVKLLHQRESACHQ